MPQNLQTGAPDYSLFFLEAQADSELLSTVAVAGTPFAIPVYVTVALSPIRRPDVQAYAFNSGQAFFLGYNFNQPSYSYSSSSKPAPDVLGIKNYPALDAHWSKEETWAVSRVSPREQVGGGVPALTAITVATSDAPNGYSVALPEPVIDFTDVASTNKVSIGGEDGYGIFLPNTAVDGPDAGRFVVPAFAATATLTFAGGALYGAYTFRHQRVYTYTDDSGTVLCTMTVAACGDLPRSRGNPPVLTTPQNLSGVYIQPVAPVSQDTRGAQIYQSAMVRTGAVTLAAPPGSESGTPADTIVLRAGHGSNFQVYVHVDKVVEPSMIGPNGVLLGYKAEDAQGNPILGGHAYPFWGIPPFGDPQANGIHPPSPDEIAPPDSPFASQLLNAAFRFVSLDSTGAIFGVNGNLFGSVPGTYHFVLYNLAVYEPYALQCDANNVDALAGLPVAFFDKYGSYRTFIDPHTYTHSRPMQFDIFPPYQLFFTVQLLGASTARPPAGGRTHAQDVSSGRVSIASSVRGATETAPRQLQAEVWEGWQNLSGTPARAAQPILGPDGQPVTGDFPHLWKVGAEGVASLVYRDANGVIVRAISRDGLYTLEAPIS